MKKIAALAGLLLAVCSINAFALFDVQYYGVRALGMGQAFTAVADDASAPMYNIAGTGFFDRAEIAGMSSRLFAGEEGINMATNFLGAVVPLSRDRLYGTLSAGWGNFQDLGLRAENIVYLGYSRHLNDVFSSDLFEISVGANFKYLQQKVDESEASSSTLHGMGTGYISQDAFAFDIGILVNFANGVSAGYSGKYLNSPDIAFYGDTYGGDRIQTHHVIGLSYFDEMLPFLKLPNFTIAADVEIRENDNIFMFGAETKINIATSLLAIRAGGWKEQLSFGAGYMFPFGNGNHLSVDYAFLLPLEIQETIGSHFFGLSYKFR